MKDVLRIIHIIDVNKMLEWLMQFFASMLNWEHVNMIKKQILALVPILIHGFTIMNSKNVNALQIIAINLKLRSSVFYHQLKESM